MKFRHHLAQQRPVGGVDGTRDLVDKLAAEPVLFVPHRQIVEHGALLRSSLGLGNVDILGHATPRRFDRLGELV